MTTEQSVAGDSARGGEIPTALQERIVRGIEHHAEHGNGIEWVAEDRCKVPSRSRVGYFHLVAFCEDGERCSCPDFQKNGQEFGACLHTVSALISWAKRTTPEAGEVVVEYHKTIRDVTGSYWGPGYVVVEVLERGSILEVLPSGNFRTFSRKNAKTREAGQMVARCENRGEAYRVIQGLTESRTGEAA